MTIFETQTEMIGLWIITILVWFEFVGCTYMVKYADWDWYDCIAGRVRGMPPYKKIFIVIWFILYVLITISIFHFVRNSFDAFTDVNSAIIDAIGFLFLFNMILNKTWGPTFFILQEATWALVILILVWISALIILILFGLEGLWVSFGTWFAYPVWLTYALYLNIAFIVGESKMDDGYKLEEILPVTDNVLFKDTVTAKHKSKKNRK